MVHIRTLMDQMIEIDEGRMKDIFTANQEGKSAKEIAKQLKLPLSTVKSILGEGKEEILEFTDSQLDVLARQYAGLKGKTISIDQANKLRKIFDRIPDRSLDALRRKKIPFLSGLALSRMVQKGMPVRNEEKECPPGQYYCKQSGMCKPNSMKEDTETPNEDDNAQNKSLKIKLDKEKDTDALEKQLIAAQGQINILKQKLENEKNKVTKPEPNRETGEVPLTVGIAHKYLKDKAEKEKDKKEVKEMAKDDAYAIGMAQAKKSMNDEPPLEKKTITKGHEIAKKILAKEDLNEAKYTINYEVESDSGADDRYVGNNDMTVNAFSPKDAVKKFGQELNKTVKQAQARGSRSILSVYMNYIEKDGNEISDREVDKLNDYASDFIYKGVYDSYMKEGKAPYRLSYDDRYGKHAGFEDAKTLQDLQNKAANLRKRGFVINKMGRNTSPVKEDKHAGAKLVYETIKGLKNKAEKSGMPYSILKKVYDRGMAAWRGGHRPGTTQQQWAFARVNSFVTKSSGTWGGADKDLAKQVRGKN